MTLFWYNPNIHPSTEYSIRRDTLAAYAQSLGLPLIMEDIYGLRQFMYGLEKQDPARFAASARLEAPSHFDVPQRCSFCYSSRMERTAFIAKEKGFDAFCTTLFISPYQNHELLRKQA
jgi:predicted adenine nucleotide alpha hydrolase (AANH) superfamily ATPase